MKTVTLYPTSALPAQAGALPVLEILDRKPVVLASTGLSNTNLYALIQKGEFPAPVRIGARAVAWRRSDWQAWVSSRLTTKVPA